MCKRQFFSSRKDEVLGCLWCYMQANPLDFSEPREPLFVLDSISNSEVIEWGNSTVRPAEELPLGGLENESNQQNR